MLLPLAAAAQHNAQSAPSVQTIIQKSLEANKRDWNANPEFDYSERDRDKDGDKTYAVTMLFGTFYSRLVAVNGKPLPPDKEKEEQHKFEKVEAERRAESPEKRAARIAKFQADRKRDHTMMGQLTVAFDFHLAGTHKLSGHSVYVLKATPRKGYQPPDRDSQVLTGMEGTLWIDRQSFQWVKVEAHVIRPVSIEGFLAQVEPGTQFELEKTPVSKDVWLPSHFAMRANAKVIHLFSHREQEDDNYFNYHRSAQSESSSAGK